MAHIRSFYGGTQPVEEARAVCASSTALVPQATSPVGLADDRILESGLESSKQP